MYLAITTRDGREVGLTETGEAVELEQAPLFIFEAEARAVAAAYGGRVETEARIFGDDVDEDDLD